MGWFRRGVDAINYADPATDLVIALSPSIRRVNKLQERGTPANGVITGIKFSLNDETTRKEFAITLPGDPQTEARRIGVRTMPARAHRLRLGVPVVVKVDGNRGILDWEAMARAWGLDDLFLSQESMRKPPEDGVVDTALDARAQRRLKKWTPARARLEAHERVSVFGMATLNWDLTLRLPDGTTAMVSKDEVPTYAQWFTAPGAELPVVVDPKDATKAAVDWPRFALEQARDVGFDDDPPPGSIAAEVEAGLADAATVASVGAQVPTAEPAAGEAVTLDATMQSWVDNYRAGYIKQKEFERTVADWKDAGMCNQAQVDLARSQAGLA